MRKKNKFFFRKPIVCIQLNEYIDYVKEGGASTYISNKENRTEKLYI